MKGVLAALVFRVDASGGMGVGRVRGGGGKGKGRGEED